MNAKQELRKALRDTAKDVADFHFRANNPLKTEDQKAEDRMGLVYSIEELESIIAELKKEL